MIQNLNDNISAADTPLNSSFSPDRKTIYINNLVTGQKNVALEVNLDETVKDLRKKIEDMFNIKLNDNHLMVKHARRRQQKSLDNEDATLREAHIKSEDIITIGRTEVKGGAISK